MARSHFTKFVCRNFVHGDFVRFIVSLNRNLSRHAAHCGDFTPMDHDYYRNETVELLRTYGKFGSGV